MPSTFRAYVAAALAAPGRAMASYETVTAEDETLMARITAISATSLGVLVVALLAVLLGLN